MKVLERNSRAVIEFTLEWNAEGVCHRDSLWADPVNMWRDCLVPGLAAVLAGKAEGEKVTVEVAADVFIPYQREKLVTIRPEQFFSPAAVSTTPPPAQGRFYPQGYLHGVDGVFAESVAPARYLGHEKKGMLFDLNHPLAGYDFRLSAEIVEIYEEKTERGGRCEDLLELITADGPGMHARYRRQETRFFSPADLERADTSPDSLFYRQPRMVQHLDSTARAAIRKQYGRLIVPGARVLDLMGSWDSHLPQDLVLGQLTVLGMNKEELVVNAMATDRVIRDLNQNPLLPFADNSFDVIVCTASVEYLTDPLAVFSELHRVLQPGGVLALAFSNRWFPPKAIGIWSGLHEFERLGMVLEMFHRTSGFQDLATLTRRGLPRPEDDPHRELSYSDPVYMAWGRKTEHAGR